MIQKTKAIVFKSTKYADSSMIVQMYTAEFGRQSFIVNGIRSNKSKQKAGLLQAGTLLDLVTYYNESKNIHRIKEMQYAHIYRSIPFDIVKSSLSIFLIEVLQKVLKEQEANPILFDYLYDSFVLLDQTQNFLSNFHLLFLIKLTKHIGFWPHGTYSIATPYFDLEQGDFVSDVPAHKFFLENEESKLLSQFQNTSFSDLSNIHLSSHHRKQLLKHILLYFEFHVEHFSNVKSPDILEQIIN